MFLPVCSNVTTEVRTRRRENSIIQRTVGGDGGNPTFCLVIVPMCSLAFYTAIAYSLACTAEFQPLHGGLAPTKIARSDHFAKERVSFAVVLRISILVYINQLVRIPLKGDPTYNLT
jgi:hypothetical protein